MISHVDPHVKTYGATYGAMYMYWTTYGATIVDNMWSRNFHTKICMSKIEVCINIPESKFRSKSATSCLTLATTSGSSSPPAKFEACRTVHVHMDVWPWLLYYGALYLARRDSWLHLLSLREWAGQGLAAER